MLLFNYRKIRWDSIFLSVTLILMPEGYFFGKLLTRSRPEVWMFSKPVMALFTN